MKTIGALIKTNRQQARTMHLRVFKHAVVWQPLCKYTHQLTTSISIAGAERYLVDKKAFGVSFNHK